MTERMTENRIRKLSVLEEKGVEEQKTKNFIIRWKEIANNRLDGKALKASFSDETFKSKFHRPLMRWNLLLHEWSLIFHIFVLYS